MIHPIKNLLLICLLFINSSCLSSANNKSPSAVFIIFIKGALIDEIHCQSALTSLPSGGFHTFCQKKPIDFILTKTKNSFEDSIKAWLNPNHINIPTLLSSNNWITSLMPASPPLSFSSDFEVGFQLIQDTYPVKKNYWTINTYSQFESLIQFSKTLEYKDKSYIVLTLEDLENEFSQNVTSREIDLSTYRESIWESIDQSLIKFMLFLDLDFVIENYSLVIFGSNNQSQTIRSLVWNSNPSYLPDLKYENLNSLDSLSLAFHKNLIPLNSDFKTSKQKKSPPNQNPPLPSGLSQNEKSFFEIKTSTQSKTKKFQSKIINNRTQDENIKKLTHEALRAFDINMKLNNPLNLSIEELLLFENLKN